MSNLILWRFGTAAFADLTVGFAIIRFISLHQVDPWNSDAPWARSIVDLFAAAGVSAVAIARLR